MLRILSAVIARGKGCIRLNREIRQTAEQITKVRLDLDRKKLHKDMWIEHIRHDTEPLEYQRYRFYEKPRAVRETYIREQERIRYFQKGSWNHFPRNKYARYQMFASLYHREVVNISRMDPEAPAIYQSFAERHPEFVAKPVKGTKGKGILRLDRKDAVDVQQLLAVTGGDCILEEIISQGSDLSLFHASSVNTVRLVTATNGKDQAEVIFALLRVGRGGSLVDNVGAGGIICLVHADMGRVISDGLCGDTYYPCHPDTKVRFKDFWIPEWKTLIQTALEAHLSYPSQRMIGWDFAWTKNGWDLVEANPSPSFASVQVLAKKGIKPAVMGVTGPFCK